MKDFSDTRTVNAASFVRLVGRCTASLLQRKYNISFMEAARLIDQLEAYGIVKRQRPGGTICDVIDTELTI